MAMSLEEYLLQNAPRKYGAVWVDDLCVTCGLTFDVFQSAFVHLWNENAFKWAKVEQVLDRNSKPMRKRLRLTYTFPDTEPVTV